tara:strand:- start:3377 stop:3628 length:252 start_codon:yes stop_codon:yes gene_type:complete
MIIDNSSRSARLISVDKNIINALGYRSVNEFKKNYPLIRHRSIHEWLVIKGHNKKYDAVIVTNWKTREQIYSRRLKFIIKEKS